MKGFPPLFAARGYKVIDPGRFELGLNDFSSQIAAFKRGEGRNHIWLFTVADLFELLAAGGAAGLQAEDRRYRQSARVPVGRRFAGHAGAVSDGRDLVVARLSVQIQSHGSELRQLCDEYEEVTKKQWSQALGVRHALFEIALDAFKRAQNPDSAASVIEAVRTTMLNTISGPIQWQGPPPNQWTQLPAKNVCTTPMTPSQWVPGTKWKYDLAIVDNKRYPLIPVQRKMVPLPG